MIKTAMSEMLNFKVRYSPLRQQFAEPDEIIDQIRELVRTGNYTLGKPVETFEKSFAELLGVKHAIGVGSGTDSLKLPLKALGVGAGDEVITSANTFIATVGAINETGARPVLIDCDDTFCMDLDYLEDAITPRTKAIMPVHMTGFMVDMPRLMDITRRHNLLVVEDTCQCMLGAYDGKNAGTWGIAAGISMHPLKLINVWGDAGIIITDDDEMDRKLRLLRNHGLKSREEVEILGYNSRLDSLQAIVGSWMLDRAEGIVEARIERARHYDRGLETIEQIRIPPRQPNVRNISLMYIVFAENRDGLLNFCREKGVEALVHYPTPLYQQEGLRHFGYKPGDFPVTDRHAVEMITFPVDQHLSRDDQDYVIRTVREFYRGK